MAAVSEDAKAAKAKLDTRFSGNRRKYLYDRAVQLKDIASNPERVEALRRSLMNEYADQGNNKNVYNTVEAVVDFYYGRSLENGLKDMFGVHEDLMNDINSGMQFVHDVFTRMYTLRKLEIVEENGVFTKEDQNNVIDELSNIVPGIRAVDASDKGERVLFIKPKIDLHDKLSTERYNALNKVKEIRTKLSDKGNIRNQKNNPNKPPTMGYIGYERHFKVDIMVDTFREPGASPLPVATHSLDAANLVRAINEASNSGDSVLALHDAMLFGSGNIHSNKALNRTLFNTNAEHSIMSGIMETIMQAYRATENMQLIDTQEPTYGIGRNLKSADDILDSLLIRSR